MILFIAPNTLALVFIFAVWINSINPWAREK